MITITKSTQLTNDTVLIEAICKSTDTKPTDGIANGSICLVMDSGKLYAYDEAGETWIELA